ncbi:MAG TPA: TraB/GumN family protein [Chiayiivirga sp.]|nr:TraB/GumN family protein [Chiayiivirga sp.]
MIRRLLAAFLLFATAIAAAAPPEPLLWTAQNGAGTVYLLGSFHLLRAEDYPLHPRVEVAYAEADRLVFEIDPAEMASPDLLATIQTLAKFDDGRTLRGVISEENAEKLKAFMGGSEAAMASSDAFKPWYVGMNLVVGMMARFGLDPKRGLDQHFMRRAAADGKPVGGLETVLQQMGALDASPLAEQEQMLSEAFAPPAEMRRRVFAMHDLWRAGDADGLLALINEDMAEKTPQMYLRLNRDRNLAWLPQVADMLERHQTVLVVVGTMHLIGDEGLVALLRARGVKVERVDAGQPVALKPLADAA